MSFFTEPGAAVVVTMCTTIITTRTWRAVCISTLCQRLQASVGVYCRTPKSQVVTCRGEAEWPSKATGAVVAAEVRAEMVFTLAHSNGRSPRAAGPWQSDRLTARRYSTEFMSQKTNPIRVDYLESGYTHSQPAYTITTTPKMAGCTLEAQTLA